MELFARLILIPLGLDGRVSTAALSSSRSVVTEARRDVEAFCAIQQLFQQIVSHVMLDHSKQQTPGRDAAESGPRWNLQRIGTVGLSLMTLLFLMAFVHPFGNAKSADLRKELMSSAQIGPPVIAIMQRSCQNCHSERTVWPAYSHLAPISWLLERDVQNGRAHWNMSQWERYGVEDREHILSQIGPMVRNRKMPLPQYLLLHPEARLSDSDAELLYQWSRQERKRLKVQAESAVPGQK